MNNSHQIIPSGIRIPFLLLLSLLVFVPVSAQEDPAVQEADSTALPIADSAMTQLMTQLDSVPILLSEVRDSLRIASLNTSIDSLLALTEVLRKNIVRREKALIPDSVNVPTDSLSEDRVNSDSIATPPLIMESDSVQTDSSLSMTIQQLTVLRDSLHRLSDSLAADALELLSVDMYTGMFRNQRFYTCAMNPAVADMRIYNGYKTGRRRVSAHNFSTLSDLATSNGQEMVFAMNAGMYEPNRMAKGLLIAEGIRQTNIDTARAGYGNFYMQPNAVFALGKDSLPLLEKTHSFLGHQPDEFSYATQSGPMMLWDGMMNPKFNDGSPNRHIRNAVGITPYNEVIFVLSERRVTFFEISSYLLSLGCTEALYLDGAISQAYMPPLGLDNLQAGNHLGPILVIFKERGE